MYLVDGNNVMGQRVGWHRDKDAARRRLVGELAELARSAAETVTVVFDGRPRDGLADDSSVDGVRVYFARIGSDADDRIVELAREADQTDKIVAVTSDRELTSRLARLDIETMRSGRFRKRLEAMGSR